MDAIRIAAVTINPNDHESILAQPGFCLPPDHYMMPGSCRSVSSFLMENDAQLRKRYRRHCRRDGGPLRRRPQTRNCMLCFIVRGRMAAIPESTHPIGRTIQDLADSETEQKSDEESRTCQGEGSESRVSKVLALAMNGDGHMLTKPAHR